MDDKKIIELFFARDEGAIAETEKKYGKLCSYIASNILASREDSEECVNDTLLALWNSIPPDEPEPLSAYIAARAKNIAISKSRANNAWKRGGNVQIVSDELLSTIPDGTELSGWSDIYLRPPFLLASYCSAILVRSSSVAFEIALRML